MDHNNRCPSNQRKSNCSPAERTNSSEFSTRINSTEREESDLQFVLVVSRPNAAFARHSSLRSMPHRRGCRSKLRLRFPMHPNPSVSRGGTSSPQNPPHPSSVGGTLRRLRWDRLDQVQGSNPEPRSRNRQVRFGCEGTGYVASFPSVELAQCRVWHSRSRRAIARTFRIN